MNLSATLSIFRLFRDPSLCLPHHTIPTFQHLPIPISQALTGDDRPSNDDNNNNNSSAEDVEKGDGDAVNVHGKVDIRAVVLDKDNCFARPGENEIYPPYEDKMRQLKAAYPGARLLIVSNSAGTTSFDPDGSHVCIYASSLSHISRLLETPLSVQVFNHVLFISLCIGTITLSILSTWNTEYSLHRLRVFSTKQRLSPSKAFSCSSFITSILQVHMR